MEGALCIDRGAFEDVHHFRFQEGYAELVFLDLGKDQQVHSRWVITVAIILEVALEQCPIFSGVAYLILHFV